MMIVGGTSTRPILAGSRGAGGTVRGRAAHHQKQQDDGQDALKRHRMELPIVIPESLKRVLVEDWDLVSRQTHLVVIPAAVISAKTLRMMMKKRSPQGREPISGFPIFSLLAENLLLQTVISVSDSLAH